MFSLRKIDYLLLFCLIYGVFTFSAVFSKRASKYQANSLPQLVDDHFLSRIKKITASYRRCLLDQLFYAKDIWASIPSAIEACTVGKFWRSLDVHSVELPCLNRHYYFIPPKPITSPCVAVRMNIPPPDNLLPEETLRRLMPQCEFFGAGQKDIVDFQSVGKFFIKLSSFTEPPEQTWDDGRGHRKNIAGNNPFYPMMVKPKSFLEKYVKRPRIDYLEILGGLSMQVVALDGKRAFVPTSCFHEYDILQQPIDITVCQVSVETFPFRIDDNGIDLMRYARPHFKPLFISLLSKSSFLPIRGEYISEKASGCLNVFYVNMSNPYCAKKYLAKCDGGECVDDGVFDD